MGTQIGENKSTQGKVLETLPLSVTTGIVAPCIIPGHTLGELARKGHASSSI